MQSRGGLVTLTFDDASRSQLERGLPVLDSAGATGVLFVPTGLLGTWFEREPLLDLDGVRRLADAGWEVGSHTVSHARLAKDGDLLLDRGVLRRELGESRAWLASRGLSPITLAYPYGRFNEEVEALAARLYRYVRTTADGLNEIAAASPRLHAYTLCDRRIPRWRRAVERAAASGGWLIGTVHHVAGWPTEIPADDERSWITQDGLADCLATAIGAGLEPCTFRDVHDRSLTARGAA